MIIQIKIIMDTLTKAYNDFVCQILYNKNEGDGNSIGSGLVVALRPPFTRLNNSLRRGGSQRTISRRPASLLSQSDIVSNSKKGEVNGFDKHENGEGPISWKISFEKLLEDPLGLHTFAEFLKKEFSAENIYFWTACERYRKLAEVAERLNEAQRIYNQHLAIGAPEGVNVDAHGRQCTEQALLQAPQSLFDLAQKQIFNLMKFDSYPRFLKSDLYQQCLNGDIERPQQLDVELLLQPASSTHGGPQSKLKKSLSNAEDRRRKSLLPWHRKNRSKSKDRGELEYSQQNRENVRASCDNVCSNNNNNNIQQNGKMCGEIHSSKSSLTSLDLALVSNQDSVKGSQDEISSIGRSALCRVILSNGSTTVVQIRPNESVEQMIKRLLEKRALHYSAFEVYTNKHSKAMDVSESSIKLAGCEVTIEQRVVFKMDLPNKKVISVKSKSTKIIVDVLKPILSKYNYNLDYAIVQINNCESNGGEQVDINQPVTAIDEKRLLIKYCEMPKVQQQQQQSSSHNNHHHPQQVPGIKLNDNKVNLKLDEITNQVFEGILQDKAADVGFVKPKSDRGSVKSEDWGSEHSSGIGRFFRRDSGLTDRRKKALMHKKPDEINNENVIKNKPLIAKWKTGVNKLQVTCSESDELVEGLTRAQRSRLEDQRGTEINFELPDFLKDNNERPATTGSDKKNSKFYLESDETRTKHNNYENRAIFPNNGVYNKIRKFSSSPSANNHHQQSTTPTIENKLDAGTNRLGDPPPLPPKPKNVPRKPPNWGHHQTTGTFDGKDLKTGKTLFLEQPSSSFV